MTLGGVKHFFRDTLGGAAVVMGGGTVLAGGATAVIANRFGDGDSSNIGVTALKTAGWLVGSAAVLGGLALLAGKARTDGEGFEQMALVACAAVVGGFGAASAAYGGGVLGANLLTRRA